MCPLFLQSDQRVIKVIIMRNVSWEKHVSLHFFDQATLKLISFILGAQLQNDSDQS